MAATQAPVSLPKVDLRELRISAEALAMLPLPLMEKYQVGVFAVTDTEIRLAIVYPEQLKQGFPTALSDLAKRMGKKVGIYQTDAASLRALLKQAKDNQKPAPAITPPQPTNSPATSVAVPPPPLFELGKTVAFNYLKRIPLSFAQDHHLVCVDFLPPATFWFVTDKEHEKHAQEVLPLIEQKNQIKGHLVLVDSKDLEELTAYYAELLNKEKVSVNSTVLKGEEEKITTPAPEPPPEPIVKGAVVTPDVQGSILSEEEDKGGLLGMFQRVAHRGEESGEEELKEAGNQEVKNGGVASVPSPLPPLQSPALPTANQVQKPLSAPTPSSVASPAATPPTAVATRPRTTEEDETDVGKLLSKPVENQQELNGLVRKGFIPQIVAAVVSFAIHEKASDVHIEAYEDEVRVRYRIDGQLVDIVKLPPDIHAALVSRIKILARLRLDESRVPQDGRFDVRLTDTQVDLRVSVLPTVHGEKVVMRILDKSRGISSLETLGIMGQGYEDLIKAINKPFGICLATGPTGSGKSTTLYAVLNRIATPNVNVVTLEDPVEYEMKGINQSQIRPKIGFTFAEGLRSILRQDPNIIMVGEVRDGETANMATQAALTGHLVLSTLHTNDASGAIPRLTNMAIEPFLIASALNVAVGQRLVRKICQNCKKPVNLPAGVQDQIKKDLDVIATINPSDAARIKTPFAFAQGVGCAVCGGKGYQGRMGIYEVMVMSDSIEELTLKRASGSEIQIQAQKEGMITMYQDGLLKVIAGLTTLDEVLRETLDK